MVIRSEKQSSRKSREKGGKKAKMSKGLGPERERKFALKRVPLAIVVGQKKK